VGCLRAAEGEGLRADLRACERELTDIEFSDLCVVEDSLGMDGQGTCANGERQ